MTEFLLEMVEGYMRPIVKLYGFPTLIDTGAIIPVFSFSDNDMRELFNAKCLIGNTSIGGFGGEDYGAVYSVPEFVIGSMKFEPLEVFVPQKLRIKYPILLSATLFYGTDYEFSTTQNLFIVKLNDGYPLCRKFKLKNFKGKLYPQIDVI